MKVVKGEFFMKIFVVYLFFIITPVYSSNNEFDSIAPQQSSAARLEAFKEKQKKRKELLQADVKAAKDLYDAATALRAENKAARNTALEKQSVEKND